MTRCVESSSRQSSAPRTAVGLCHAQGQPRQGRVPCQQRDPAGFADRRDLLRLLDHPQANEQVLGVDKGKPGQRRAKQIKLRDRDAEPLIGAVLDADPCPGEARTANGIGKQNWRKGYIDISREEIVRRGAVRDADLALRKHQRRRPIGRQDQREHAHFLVELAGKMAGQMPVIVFLGHQKRVETAPFHRRTRAIAPIRDCFRFDHVASRHVAVRLTCQWNRTSRPAPSRQNSVRTAPNPSRSLKKRLIERH